MRVGIHATSNQSGPVPLERESSPPSSYCFYEHNSVLLQNSKIFKNLSCDIQRSLGRLGGKRFTPLIRKQPIYLPNPKLSNPPLLRPLLLLRSPLLQHTTPYLPLPSYRPVRCNSKQKNEDFNQYYHYNERWACYCGDVVYLVERWLFYLHIIQSIMMPYQSVPPYLLSYDMMRLKFWWREKIEIEFDDETKSTMLLLSYRNHCID